jgi:hypothetical protein
MTTASNFPFPQKNIVHSSANLFACYLQFEDIYQGY